MLRRQCAGMAVRSGPCLLGSKLYELFNLMIRDYMDEFLKNPPGEIPRKIHQICEFRQNWMSNLAPKSCCAGYQG